MPMTSSRPPLPFGQWLGFRLRGEPQARTQPESQPAGGPGAQWPPETCAVARQPTCPSHRVHLATSGGTSQPHARHWW